MGIASLSVSYRPVIPDTCMDIIVRVHPFSHTVSTVFCAMDERPYWTDFVGFLQDRSGSALIKRITIPNLM